MSQTILSSKLNRTLSLLRYLKLVGVNWQKYSPVEYIVYSYGLNIAYYNDMWHYAIMTWKLQCTITNIEPCIRMIGSDVVMIFLNRKRKLVLSSEKSWFLMFWAISMLRESKVQVCINKKDHNAEVFKTNEVNCTKYFFVFSLRSPTDNELCCLSLSGET